MANTFVPISYGDRQLYATRRRSDAPFKEAMPYRNRARTWNTEKNQVAIQIRLEDEYTTAFLSRAEAIKFAKAIIKNTDPYTALLVFDKDKNGLS